MSAPALRPAPPAAWTHPVPLVHPGEVLREEVMAPLGLSARALARALNVPANRIGAILSGERGITADTALRLARYLGTSPDFWLGLQADHDLRHAHNLSAERIAREVVPMEASASIA